MHTRNSASAGSNHRLRRRTRTFVRALVALVAIGGAAPVDAQTTTPPHVYVTPGDHATLATSIQITLGWCYYPGGWGDPSQRQIRLNGQDVSANFTTTNDNYWEHPECDGWEQSVGTVPLSAGTNTLNAYIMTYDGYASTGGVAVYARPAPSRGVRVGAEIAPASVATLNPVVQRFKVWNIGEVSATYTLTASCAGGAAGGSCTPSPASVTVAAQQSANVSVNFTSGATAGTTGIVALRAIDNASSLVKDTAWADVNVVAAPPAVAFAPTAPGLTLEKDLCVAVAIASDVASECGALRMTHPMPAVRTVGKARAPVLVYYLDQVHEPRLPVDVTFPAGTTADQVELKVTENVSGTPLLWTRTYSGSAFPAGQTMRLNAGLGALFSRGTGIYGIRVEVARITGSTRTLLGSVLTRDVAIVNRVASPFGPGWWVAGLERLHLGQPGSRILWVGGDGSTRAYASVATGTWVAPAVDRPDTLKLTNGRYVRSLRHGVKVYFDSQGRHEETTDRLGHTTRFIYRTDNAQLLDRIELPPQGSGLSYRFTYDGTARLSSVLSPGATADRITRVYRGSIGVDSIVDPDSTKVTFSYGSAAPLVQSRTDRRGVSIEFCREPGGPGLCSAQLTLESGQILQHTFRTPNGLGAGASDAPVSADSGYFLYDGPRTDVADLTRIWLGALGAPIRVLNAMGRITTVEYGDARFPGLSTRTRAPSGLVSTAAFNARGLPDNMTVEKPLGGTQNAVTAYVWHPTWDSPTQVTSPTGVVSKAWYDPATGNVDSLQNGGDARRVRLTYNATGAAKGLVATLKTPLSPVERLYYDARGNLNKTQSPKGFVALSLADAIGRDTLVVTPINPSQAMDSASVRAHGGWTRLSYDVMNQVRREVTFGPAVTVPTSPGSSASGAIPADSVVVEHVHDAEGNKLTTKRQFARPGTTAIELHQDSWEYDRGGRVTRHLSPVAETRFAHDLAGNATTTTTGRGHLITTRHDALGRVLERIVPEVTYGSTGCYGLWGASCTFSLPTRGGSSVCIPADTARFGYDAAGNVVRADNGAARIRRTYHPNGLLATDTLRIRTYHSSFATACEGSVPQGQRPYPLTDFDKHVHALRVTYDLDGRRTSLAHPTNLRPGTLDQIYQYVPATGELQSVADVRGNLVSFSYDAEGRLRTTTYPGAWTDTRSYDEDGRVYERAVTHFGTDQLTFDARGRVVSGTLGVGAVAGTIVNWPIATWYDGLGAVVATDGLTETVSGSFEEFRTDAIGNRHWQRQYMLRPNQPDQDGERDLSYDGLGRLVEVHSRPDPLTNFFHEEYHGYDAVGNGELARTKRYENGALTHDVSKSYYDADQRLRVQNRHVGLHTASAAGGVFEEYRYDALGRRVLVRSRPTTAQSYWKVGNATPCGTECRKGYLERIVWDGDQVLYEVRTAGADSVPSTELEKDNPSSTQAHGYPYGRVAYTHAQGIDQPVLIARSGLSGLADPTVMAPHADWRGRYRGGSYTNGQPCTAGSGCTLVDWPAGELTVDGQRTQPAAGAWFGNLPTGKSDGSGLQYMRNRYYDPKTGRFTQEDPIGLAGGLNLYGYANGDPVNFSDPFGLMACPPDCGAADAADLGVGMVPIASTIHDATIVLTGKNAITGEDVGAGGRAIALVGLVTPASGGQIRGAGKLITLSRHYLDQKINRMVRSADVLDALKNPLKGKAVKVDAQGRPSQQIIGEKATVVQNPETGTLINTWPTSSKVAEKLQPPPGGHE